MEKVPYSEFDLVCGTIKATHVTVSARNGKSNSGSPPAKPGVYLSAITHIKKSVQFG